MRPTRMSCTSEAALSRCRRRSNVRALRGRPSDGVELADSEPTAPHCRFWTRLGADRRTDLDPADRAEILGGRPVFRRGAILGVVTRARLRLFQQTASP